MAGLSTTTTAPDFTLDDFHGKKDQNT